MRMKPNNQIQRNYRDTLIQKSREIIEEDRKRIYHQHWQSLRDTHREVRDFYRNFG